MLRSFVPTVLISLLSLTSASAQTTQPQPSFDGPVVIASGEATVKRAPDRAFLTVTVESRAKGPREAQKLNAEAMTAVLQKLKSSLPEDAIRTHGYDLQPEYDYRDGRQTLRGYL